MQWQPNPFICSALAENIAGLPSLLNMGSGMTILAYFPAIAAVLLLSRLIQALADAGQRCTSAYDRARPASSRMGLRGDVGGLDDLVVGAGGAGLAERPAADQDLAAGADLLAAAGAVEP